MLADTARQREGVIRKAKFPRTPGVVPYTQARRIISDFLAGNTGDLSQIDAHISQLDTRRRREADGWNRDELKRNMDALEAFKLAFRKRRLARLTFAPGPADLTMTLDGVRVNARLDARLIETQDDGTAFGGGAVLFLAGAEPSRKNLAERSKLVAGIAHWNLENVGGNIEPLHRLCLSFDVFGHAITKAPEAIDRLRENVRSSCREAARNWDSVPPPEGYDGPDWR